MMMRDAAGGEFSPDFGAIDREMAGRRPTGAVGRPDGGADRRRPGAPDGRHRARLGFQHLVEPFGPPLPR